MSILAQSYQLLLQTLQKCCQQLLSSRKHSNPWTFQPLHTRWKFTHTCVIKFNRKKSWQLKQLLYHLPVTKRINHLICPFLKVLVLLLWLFYQESTTLKSHPLVKGKSNRIAMNSPFLHRSNTPLKVIITNHSFTCNLYSKPQPSVRINACKVKWCTRLPVSQSNLR